MSSAKVAAAAVLVALSLSACGVASKPEAGSAQAAKTSEKQLVASDPRTPHVKCLARHHIGYTLQTIDGHPAIQVGTHPTGPTIIFTATPGAAQDVAITGEAQGAEVIGAALVYPYATPDALMGKVEACMRLGVTG